jgi:hypothetical protein
MSLSTFCKSPDNFHRFVAVFHSILKFSLLTASGYRCNLQLTEICSSPQGPSSCRRWFGYLLCASHVIGYVLWRTQGFRVHVLNLLVTWRVYPFFLCSNLLQRYIRRPNTIGIGCCRFSSLPSAAIFARAVFSFIAHVVGIEVLRGPCWIRYPVPLHALHVGFAARDVSPAVEAMFVCEGMACLRSCN